MYDYKIIKSLAKLHTSIIELDESLDKENDIILNSLFAFKSYCKSLIELDNQISKIFGYYGLYSNIDEVSKKLNISNELVTETIVFEYTKDVYISIIIKEMFHMSNSGNTYNAFLRKQIQTIVHSGNFTEFNMRKEYIQFCHFNIYIKRNYYYCDFPKTLLKNGETFDIVGYNEDGSYFMPELDKSEPDE